MSDRITEGLKWLAEEVSATRDEFRRGNQPGGDMLLQACISQGYVACKGERIAVSQLGRRRLADRAPAPEAEVE